MNSAGNNRFAHWGGIFADPDGNGWLNFSGGNEINRLEIGDQAGFPNTIGMIWSEPWGQAAVDYDLYIVQGNDLNNVVASSKQIQNGSGNPSESLSFVPEAGIDYGIAVRLKNPSSSQTIFSSTYPPLAPSHPSIAVDLQKNWHIAYLQIELPTANSTIYKINYLNSQNTTPVTLAQTTYDASGGTASVEPSIAVDANGALYIVYRQSISGNPAQQRIMFKFVPRIQMNDLSQTPLEFNTPETSLLIPADNKNNIAVGAVAWNDPHPRTIKDYSSRGPTTDGRVKPDIAGPTDVSVSNLSGGFFNGTSAAAPHVAGAAALMRDGFPALNQAQVRQTLEDRATPEGDPGKDNVFGSGFLQMGNPPPKPPKARFSGEPKKGKAPLTVQFQDKSKGTVTSWLWNFGDGQQSTAQNPTHTYMTPGKYTVSLTVSNESGSDTKTKNNYITVQQARP